MKIGDTLSIHYPPEPPVGYKVVVGGIRYEHIAEGWTTNGRDIYQWPDIFHHTKRESAVIVSDSPFKINDMIDIDRVSDLPAGSVVEVHMLGHKGVRWVCNGQLLPLGRTFPLSCDLYNNTIKIIWMPDV